MVEGRGVEQGSEVQNLFEEGKELLLRMFYGRGEGEGARLVSIEKRKMMSLQSQEAWIAKIRT